MNQSTGLECLQSRPAPDNCDANWEFLLYDFACTAKVASLGLDTKRLQRVMRN